MVNDQTETKTLVTGLLESMTNDQISPGWRRRARHHDSRRDGANIHLRNDNSNDSDPVPECAGDELKLVNHRARGHG